jgi:hypothetical protein
MAKNANTETKVITGKVRFSYLHVWDPYAAAEGQEKRYSVCLLIPKKDKVTLEKIKKAIDAAKEVAKSKNGGKLPKNFNLPMHDGDEERGEDEDYAGYYYVNASSVTKPGLVDRNANPIMDQDELYSGCYGYASVNFYSYSKAGNNGIACGLNHLMKTADGGHLGGRSSAASDFANVKIDDDDDEVEEVEEECPW